MGLGGKREGAGRKKTWLEPMMKVQIPKRLRDDFYAWRDGKKLQKLEETNEKA